MKKIFCVVIGILIFFFLVGCSTEKTSSQEALPEITQLASKMEEAWNKVKTCKTNVDMTMDIKAGSAQNAELIVNTSIETLTDLRDRKMHMVNEMRINSGTLSQVNTQEVFLIEDTVYLRKDSEWKEKQLSEMDTDLMWAEHNNMVSGSKLRKMLLDMPAEIEGIEKHAGYKCYKIKIESKDFQLDPEVFNTNSIPGSLPYEINNMNILIWVDTETFLMNEYRMEADVAVDDGKVTSKGRLTQDFTIWDYNKDLNIKLPINE